MGKRAEQHGGESPTGNRTTGYGWLRPGYLTMPVPSNDNRMAPSSLLRKPRFWVWIGLMALGLTWIATRF